MKKLLSILMVLLIVFGLTACASGNNDTTPTDTGNNDVSNQEQDNNVDKEETVDQNEDGVIIPDEIIGRYVCVEFVENGEDKSETFRKLWEDKTYFIFVDITKEGKLVMYTGTIKYAMQNGTKVGELDKSEMSSDTIARVNTESIVLDNGEEFKIENQRLIFDNESYHMVFEKTDEIPD